MKKTIDSLLQEYDFVIEIRNFNLNKAFWQEEFSRNMQDWGFLLEDKYIYLKIFDKNENGKKIAENTYSKYLIGFFQLLDKDEVLLAENTAFFECPFLQHVHGYYCVQFNLCLDFNSFDDHFIASIKESMGRIFSTINDVITYYPCVTELECIIDLEKNGFQDGAIFLSRKNPAYLQYVILKIKQEFNQYNYDADVHYIPSCHNPIRYNYFINLLETAHLYSTHEIQLSKEQIPPFLFSCSIKIWAFNFDDATKDKFYKVAELR